MKIVIGSILVLLLASPLMVSAEQSDYRAKPNKYQANHSLAEVSNENPATRTDIRARLSDEELKKQAKRKLPSQANYDSSHSLATVEPAQPNKKK